MGTREITTSSVHATSVYVLCVSAARESHPHRVSENRAVVVALNLKAFFVVGGYATEMSPCGEGVATLHILNFLCVDKFAELTCIVKERSVR